ncbi:hypothetical protein B0H16DRAFT_1574911 [Mycena metata]|uniref:Uncharacterized protein n=1 Tax=Mycena metata TaxID=1033252 RepID=A0AAD7I789_9AGAR|nr:hypothetical protein B0H16DRAFT_1574911 [Mycena metata]
MLCVVLYLYATSLTLWVLTVVHWFKTTHTFFMNEANIPLPDRRDIANNYTISLGAPEESLFMFNMIVGDTVVIWRAWVLYQRTSRWFVAIPCLMLLMSFIFAVIDITCLTGAGWSVQSAIAGGGPVCAQAELISWAFSFATNGTCTILIGFRAWQHRQSMKALNIVGNPRRMSTDKVLSILVESGFVYCLFWATQYILFVDVSRHTPLIYAYELFSGMGDQISGMYPTLIICIVNFHQTIWEDPSATVELGRPSVTVSSVQWTGPSGSRPSPTDTLPGKHGFDIQLDSMTTDDSTGVNVRSRGFKHEAFENV